MTHSRSSSKVTAQAMAVPSDNLTSTSLTASSTALSTISRTGSWITASIATVPEKLAAPRSGSISIRYVSGSTVRGKRNAVLPGTSEDVVVGWCIRGRLPAALRVGSRSVPETVSPIDAEPASSPVQDKAVPHDLDVVAIGSPLLDVIELASGEQLTLSGLAKGSMTLIDLAKAKEIQALMVTARHVSGGSVANTAAGIAELGGTAGFVGAVADDEVGHTLRREPARRRRRVRAALQRGGGRRPRHGTLCRPHHRGRRPHDGDLSRRRFDPDASRCARGLRRAGLDRAARGISLGRAGGQGGHASRRRDRPCRRRLGGPVPVGSLLREPAPA